MKTRIHPRRAPSRRRVIVTLATVLAVLLAACGSADQPESGEPTVPSVPSVPSVTVQPSVEPLDAPVQVPATGDGDVVVGEVPAELMARIRADAAERTGADPESMTEVRGMALVWSDGSLGCPEPGVLYTQALVDGYHVVLAGPDGDLDYRVAGSDGFVLCEDDIKNSGSGSGIPTG